MRGNRSLAYPAICAMGSIPACAGEPRQAAGACGGHGVYPRVCGGTALLASPSNRAAGLSPRVRGNRVALQRVRLDVGSIPACAGEPSCSSLSCSARPVYPRVCGGTDVACRPDSSSSGLSPRVRGNHEQHGSSDHQHRSIPACAGEPSGNPRRPHGGTVYPRVCGGTAPRVAVENVTHGLSPRVRGNPLLPEIGGKEDRSIPACAGEP